MSVPLPPKPDAPISPGKSLMALAQARVDDQRNQNLRVEAVKALSTAISGVAEMDIAEFLRKSERIYIYLQNGPTEVLGE